VVALAALAALVVPSLIVLTVNPFSKGRATTASVDRQVERAHEKATGTRVDLACDRVARSGFICRGTAEPGARPISYAVAIFRHCWTATSSRAPETKLRGCGLDRDFP
jgi:hypothetical protein